MSAQTARSIKVEISTDQGRSWDEVCRWRGTGELRPRWTEKTQPEWYRQTDIRTADEITAEETVLLEARIARMHPEHQAIVRQYYALADIDAKATFICCTKGNTLKHDLIVRPYYLVLRDLAEGRYS